jgi:hypothetical protein
MPRQPSVVAVATGFLLAVAACSDNSQPTDPSTPPSTDSPNLSAAQGQPTNPMALLRGVRGFGGFFLDAQGNPTVYLKSSAERPHAERALEPWLRAKGRSASQLRVLQGEFEWAQLERWFPQASSEVFAFAGAVFVDADEAANRLRIGVERGTPAGQIRAALSRRGIPEAAVIVMETEPIRQLATLRDAVRPTIGGLQINFDPDLATPGSFVCTLGFNTFDGNARSFITNSHCTNEQGGVEGTLYWQPLRSTNPTAIATEVEDPEYFRQGCFPGRVCRFSDASRALYAEGTQSELGTIAKTPGPNGSGTPQLTIAGTFQITAEDLSTEFVIGSILNKVGRTTGWTQGPVVLTCANFGVFGSNVVQLCQTVVETRSAAGDSGSPVFEGENDVTLAGIHWGGGTLNGAQVIVFSPLANIEQELGPQTTH